MTSQPPPALSPAAVVTDERVRILRHKFDTMPGGGTLVTEFHCRDVAAICEELLLLRTKGAGVSRWISWNDGESLPMQAIYVITNVEGYVDMVTAERFERERAIAYWSEPVAAPYDPSLAPTTPKDEK